MKPTEVPEVRNPILKETYGALQERIRIIKGKLTGEIAIMLREARDSRDWQDYALWEGLLREKEMLEWELSSLLTALREFTFIDEVYTLFDKDKVTIGKTVTVKNLTRRWEIEEYSIVGSLDVIYNPSARENNFISEEAPLIQPLLDKSVGERLKVQLPRRRETFEILEIRPLTIFIR